MNPADKNELTHTLTREAERFTATHGADLSLDGVLARAGEIRRGRRMRATLVMAAVTLAVALPVGITVLNQDDDRTPPVADAPSNADTSALALDLVKEGTAPATGWYGAGTLHRGLTEIPVGKGGAVNAIARIDGGFLLERQTNDGPLEASFLPDDGSGGQSWPTQGGFAVSPGGNVGAFVEPDGTVIAVQDGGARFFQLGTVPAENGGALYPAAVTGENCSGRSEQTGCTVYVNDKGMTPRVWTVTDHGEVDTFAGSLRSVADATSDRLAGIVSVDEAGSTCSAVTELDGRQLWKTCAAQFRSFSPDGEHLLGTGAYGDGEGDTRMFVLDAATGKQVLALGAANGVVIRGLTWEDDEHVLALIRQGDRAGVLRIALDGSRELALPPLTGADEFDLPYAIPGS